MEEPNVYLLSVTGMTLREETDPIDSSGGGSG